jgi:glycosyltransferase involved in cell wall biosynthesis
MSTGSTVHVAIPFYMDTIANSFGRPERMWGRAVANHGFVRALAESSAGCRLTLFVPTRKDVGRLQQTLLAGLPRPVTVVPFGAVAGFLQAESVDVVHVLDPNLWIGAHIRNTLSPSPFAVTGMTHSLANEHFLNWAMLNSANGVTDGDCLVCTTPSAQAVVDGLFRRLAGSQPGFRAPATTVIPLGAPQAGDSEPSRLSRVELGISDDDFVVLSFARFNPQFKMDLLPVLNLGRMLGRATSRPVRLVLAGAADTGAYARFIQDQVREQGLGDTVRLVLDASDRDRQGLFGIADAFLSLSDNIQETFGLTVVEALAAGLPVVASDWDGYRSLVEDGRTGFLVPTRVLAPDPQWESTLALQLDSLMHMYCAQSTAVDLDVAAECLGQLAADRELAKRMGQAAAASVAPLAWANVISQYRALWTKLRDATRATGDTRGQAVPPTRSSAIAVLGDFAGYASARLSPGDRFAISRLGQSLRDGKALVNLYEHTDEFLDLKLLEQLLRLFTTERTVTDVLARLQSEPGRDALQVRQNILWLYKYGYLTSRGTSASAPGQPT